MLRSGVPKSSRGLWLGQRSGEHFCRTKSPGIGRPRVAAPIRFANSGPLRVGRGNNDFGGRALSEQGGFEVRSRLLRSSTSAARAGPSAADGDAVAHLYGG